MSHLCHCGDDEVSVEISHFEIDPAASNGRRSNHQHGKFVLELMDGRGLVLLRALSRLHIYPRSGAHKNDTGVREGLRAPPAGMLHHFQHLVCDCAHYNI